MPSVLETNASLAFRANFVRAFVRAFLRAFLRNNAFAPRAGSTCCSNATLCSHRDTAAPPGDDPPRPPSALPTSGFRRFFRGGFDRVLTAVNGI
jgi:hypothetical protein